MELDQTAVVQEGQDVPLLEDIFRDFLLYKRLFGLDFHRHRLHVRKYGFPVNRTFLLIGISIVLQHV